MGYPLEVGIGNGWYSPNESGPRELGEPSPKLKVSVSLSLA